MKELYFKYYDELPPPIAERAKANLGFAESGPTSLPEALASGFNWANSPEGYGFWRATYIATIDRELYPELPT